MAKSAESVPTEAPLLSFSDFYALVIPSLLQSQPALAQPDAGSAYGPSRKLVTAVLSQYVSYVRGSQIVTAVGWQDPEGVMEAVGASAHDFQRQIVALREQRAAAARRVAEESACPA